MSFSQRMAAEGTDIEYKVSLEQERPKTWLKCVSAFANGMGGRLVFGVRNEDKMPVGLENPDDTAQRISQMIASRLDPRPDVVIRQETVEGRPLIVCEVKPGPSTPYYVVQDNARVAYIRLGDESVVATAAQLNELILKGSNKTFDSVVTDVRMEEMSFSLLQATFFERTESRFEAADYISFGLCTKEGMLTNAGLLFADNCPFTHSRAFCTRWNGLDKASVLQREALDDKEYQGNLIWVLKNTLAFIDTHNKRSWKKTAQGREDRQDYSQRAYFEGVVNALIHRAYTQVGSEIHVDIFDDRLSIWSPGGMYSGEDLSKADLFNMQSSRRNPVIADLFNRMQYMERRGSGLRKILTAVKDMPGYKEASKPQFRADQSGFTLLMWNLNHKAGQDRMQETGHQTEHQTGHQTEHQTGHEGRILAYCVVPRSRAEIMAFIGLSSREHFSGKYLRPLVTSGKLRLTIPDNPRDKNQKYITVQESE